MRNSRNDYYYYIKLFIFFFFIILISNLIQQKRKICFEVSRLMNLSICCYAVCVCFDLKHSLTFLSPNICFTTTDRNFEVFGVIMPRDFFVDDQSSSWGESLKLYETQKKTLSWKNEEFVPAPKMSSYDIAVKQREVDPVTMSFRDTAREEHRIRARTAKDDEKRRSWNSTKATQRNILVNTSNKHQLAMYQTIRDAVAPPPPRDRNLISHLNNGPDHIHCPIIYNDQYMMEKVHVRKKATPVKDVRERDFNMITNIYVDNDTSRKLEEHDMTRDYIRTKYGQMNILDPIKMEYCDEAKNEIEHMNMATKVVETRERKVNNLPPGMKYSEGRSYDILNPKDVIDPTGLNQVLLKETMRANRNKKIQVESKQRLRGQSDYEKSENRRMERVKYDRVKYQIERGYNPINLSTDLKGPSRYGVAPPTMWSRFQRDERSGGFSGLGNNELSLIRRAPTAHSSGMGRLLSGRDTSNGGVYIASNNDSSSSSSSSGKNVIQGGAGDVYPARESARALARASTAQLSVRPSTIGTPGSAKATLPILDLSKASIEEKVTYDESKAGPSGMPIPMVRTGSMLSMR